jgi:HPt (histidine-containing phosphotransfer) domain-containing protein
MDLAHLLSRKAVEGLDIQKGIALYDGRISVYMEVLEAFHEQGLRQITAMRDALKAGDFMRYGIETHALKTAARGIGAIMLGELAAESDAAGKRGDREAVQKRSGRLLRRYKALIDALTTIGLGSQNGVMAERVGRIHASDLRRRLDAAVRSAANYDLTPVNETLRDLLRYELDAPVEEKLRFALSMSLQFQYEETEGTLRDVVKNLTTDP